MATETYDCIVLGVGGFGSGVLFHLARRGVRVLGIERFGVAHDRGSSHGETRIIRKAYFEHVDYVPLMLRGYELWSELEAASGQRLYHDCGLLLVGPPEGEAIAGAQLAGRRHSLRIEDVGRDEFAARFPGFRCPDGCVAVFEPEAGYLEVELCVRAHIDQAIAQGAVLQTGETVLGWTDEGGSVHVRTNKGDYRAAKLVITAGAWASAVLGDLAIPLEVLRKPLLWCPVTTNVYEAAGGAPTFYYEMPAGSFYGFPSLDDQSLKLAEHSGGKTVADPLTVDRELRPSDVESIGRFLNAALPGVSRAPVRHAVCMYTVTPDRHFIVDWHPRCDNVVIGAGFSGHGFKFTGVLGAALADLALDGHTDLPIEFLSLNRSSLRP